ncbi:histone-lysine N-methyltransferase SETMAR-like [Anastrepha obliqua]|uniref:histone-lysine N-methyltransferase SETMAR-like n=1 Tax=Anastrepha obliqua TaxID=95512 RepID=UPI002409F3B0|nr:histone-lysine N-methyltransferase SETMAR-like [Anastrepha obliqua]
MSDRKVKVREIADILKILVDSVHTIIHEYLGMIKVFSKWVPRLLTPEQKQQRIDDSKSCLDMFMRNKSEFLRRYITMDETWIHHFTPESNRQSAEWHAAGESRPKRPKTQQSAGKIMVSAFWDAHGIIFIDYLQKEQTINRDYYIALLGRLKDEIAKKRLHMAKKKVLFHQDNAPCVSQINENDGKIDRIGLRIASPSTVFSRFGPQRLLALRRPQKDARW